ncbi:hypothetical protein M2116_000270 [Aurantimicrobium minutum]|nr:hypothetical protein [Aurantimicrobium minutum]
MNVASYSLIFLLFYGAIVFLYFWGASKVGRAAERKLRNRKSFFWLSLVFSPLITALIVAALPFPDSETRKLI